MEDEDDDAEMADYGTARTFRTPRPMSKIHVDEAKHVRVAHDISARLSHWHWQEPSDFRYQ